MRAFVAAWEATGLALRRGSNQSVQLLLYMKPITRLKHAVADYRAGRKEEYQPPPVPPPGTISIFTDGSAFYNKERKE